MQTKTSKEIRQMWLDFFESKNHQVVESKSLVPVNDPSLLWINSGVATLKDYFSGIKIPKNPKITNSQKSIRTNDIENVGVTARHHTFFEMLGNFSIGDYFKEEAIELAYEMLTEVFKFDLDKLYFTYYEEDAETLAKWKALGIADDHLVKGDKDMNFWDMGKGPCGPDTEIFYDRGEKYDLDKVGVKLIAEDIENDRYVEIWNVVFSEFNNDGEGNYKELKQKNIDTGAGLERIVSIFQDAPTNFDTDLFLPIIRTVEKMSNEQYVIENYFMNDPKQTEINKKFKIIADHSRAIAVAIQDGAEPSNTSRGYIIRRLIRRTYRAGVQLGLDKTGFISKLLPVIQDVLHIYKLDIEKIAKIIDFEETAFSKTLEKGEALLFKEIENKKELDFSVAFKLFETYGFPIEMTKEIVEEKGISLDITKFEEYKAKHAAASRSSKKSAMKSQIEILNSLEEKVSEFIGYESLTVSSRIKMTKEENGKYYTLTNRTVFYATGGGQEFDSGTIGGVEVIDVLKDKHGNNWHVTASPVEGLRVELIVNKNSRRRRARNHSATHLLAAALKEVTGKPTLQASSYNDDQKLTFGFKTNDRLTENEIKRVGEIVNKYITDSLDSMITSSTLDEAIANGATVLEDEDYSEVVRVVDFGVSKELCGGTHVENTSIIQKFLITKYEKRGTGIFRIEAITSNKKVEEFEYSEKETAIHDLEKIISKNKKLDSKYSIPYKDDIKSILKATADAIKDKMALIKNSLTTKVDFADITPVDINGIKTIEIEVDNSSSAKSTLISVRNEFKDSLVIVTSKEGLVGMGSLTYDCQEQFSKQFPNAKGGGNKEFVMGKL